MFGLFKKYCKPVQDLPRYADVYETMLYRTQLDVQNRAMPTIYAFRVKDSSWSPDPRPDFVLLETDQEIQEWQQEMAGLVMSNEEGHVTDAPLLRWNNIPSLLTADNEIVATYLPVVDDANWPTLAVQAHPFNTAFTTRPARDRYYFAQNKVVGFL